MPMKLVLDTNVVLDWLLFDDPNARELRHRIDSGGAIVVTALEILEEVRRVLDYEHLGLNAVTQEDILRKYAAQTTLAPMPTGFSRMNLHLPSNFPRCRDRDDELFLAVAYHAKADALLTKDKQLLVLRRRVKKFGVNIVGVVDSSAMLFRSPVTSSE